MRKEDLSIDITFNPCQFLLDSPFNERKSANKRRTGGFTGNVAGFSRRLFFHPRCTPAASGAPCQYSFSFQLYFL